MSDSPQIARVPLVLAVDIGGTKTKVGLIAAGGEINSYCEFPTEANGTDPEPFFKRLFSVVDERIAVVGDALIGIGVSTHGEIDRDRRSPLIAGNTPALRNVDMRSRIEERYRTPTTLNNDLTAHALGEYHYGCGRGIERFMCMAIGTGLGAAMIVNGRPLIIDGGNSGNTGLIILDPEKPRDSNGIPGSAEGLCGVPGIERLARERYGHDVKSHTVIAAARAGDDPIAEDIMAQVGTWLGQALASLSVIFYPHCIALTGGTATVGPVLLNACRYRFDYLVGEFFRDIALNTGGHFQNVEIVLGQCGARTGLLGAAVELFLDRNLL